MTQIKKEIEEWYLGCNLIILLYEYDLWILTSLKYKPQVIMARVWNFKDLLADI